MSTSGFPELPSFCLLGLVCFQRKDLAPQKCDGKDNLVLQMPSLSGDMTQINLCNRHEISCPGVLIRFPVNSAQLHTISFISRLAHYSQLHDVQTLAMLCSVFEAQSRLQGCPNSYGPFPQRASNLASHSRYV